MSICPLSPGTMAVRSSPHPRACPQPPFKPRGGIWSLKCTNPQVSLLQKPRDPIRNIIKVMPVSVPKILYSWARKGDRLWRAEALGPPTLPSEDHLRSRCLPGPREGTFGQALSICLLHASSHCNQTSRPLCSSSL